MFLMRTEMRVYYVITFVQLVVDFCLPSAEPELPGLPHHSKEYLKTCFLKSAREGSQTLIGFLQRCPLQRSSTLAP